LCFIKCRLSISENRELKRIFESNQRWIQNLSENSKEKDQCERPSHRWQDNTGENPKQIGYEDVDFIPLAQDRMQWSVVNMVLHPQVP
jgi:hypothetical protein